MPNEKKTHYDESTSIDSMKQFLMMEFKEWQEEDIEAHERDVSRLLLSHLSQPEQAGTLPAEPNEMSPIEIGSR